SNADFVNGRVAIGDINFGHDFFASVGAGVDVELPVFFPTASIFAGTIHFNPTIGYNTVSKKFTFTGGTPTATDENGVSVGIPQLFAFDPSKLSLLDGL